MSNCKRLGIWVLVTLFIGSPLLAALSDACVGRKLTIGYQDITEQVIMAELMSILIAERTGTKVVLKEVEDSLEAHRALEANDIQIFIEYTGIGLKEILGEKPDTNTNPKKVYKRVRKAYIKNFNLIWLKTFGFTGTSEDAEYKDLPMYAAPIVRKDTLEKFPALSRLINKLKGKIDDQTMGQLIVKVEQEGKTPKEVAGTFLSKLGIAFALPNRA